MLGADVETGGVWDPLGFASKATDAGLNNYRQVELKHGRLAMLAAVRACACECRPDRRARSV